MTQEAIKALVKAQTEMGKVLKNAENPHLKRKYADLGAVIDACFEALHNNGFAVMQPCGSDERGQYADTIFAHESGHSFSSRVHPVIGKNDMQGLGSAITYARRYGLLGMAGLAPEDDDGEATKAAPRNQGNDNRQQGRTAENAKRDPESQARQSSERDKVTAESMVKAIRQHGASSVVSDPKFKADLETLRKTAPDLAAWVEMKINEQKEAA